MVEVTLQERLAVKNPPQKPPAMYQQWRDLLFLHWKYDKEEIQKTLPDGLYVDTFNGDAYLTITPFLIKKTRLMTYFAIPGLSNFIEINFRTYVYDEKGTPGVWFYSLDINSYLAATAARNTYGLPYFVADLEKKKEGDRIVISGKRTGFHDLFHYDYYKQNKFYIADQETLDFFLIERYVLFSLMNGRLMKAQVHHQSYPLSNTTVERWDTHLFEMNSFKNPLNHKPDKIHYAAGVNVDIFTIEKV